MRGARAAVDATGAPYFEVPRIFAVHVRKRLRLPMRYTALVFLAPFLACSTPSEVVTSLPSPKPPAPIRIVEAPQPGGGEIATVDPWGELAQKAIASGDFSELERRAVDLLAQQKDDRKARELENLYYPFYLLGHQEDERTTAALNRWVERSAAPHVARIARGMYLTGTAWEARGTGVARDIEPKRLALHRERVERAAADFREAARIEPGDPNAFSQLIELGTFHCEPRERIESYYERALAAAPGHRDARIEKFHYLEPRWCGDSEEMFEYAFRMGDEADRHAAAALVLPFALEEENFHPRLGLSYGEKLKHADPWDAVVEAARRYFEVFPDDLRQRVALFEMGYRNERWDFAVEQANAIGNRWTPWVVGDSADAYRQRAAFAYGAYAEALNDPASAIPFLDRAAELMPEKAYRLYRAGYARMATDQVAPAEEWFRRALAVDPEYVDAFVGLIYVLGDKGCEEVREMLATPVRKKAEASHPDFMKEVEKVCGIRSEAPDA